VNYSSYVGAFQMVVKSLKQEKIAVSDVMLAFAQSVNLNSDTQLQHCITKCLTSILETYLSEKLSAILEIENPVSDRRPSLYQSTQVAGVATGRSNFTDDEKRAIHALVRTYLSNFNSELTPNTHVNAAQNHTKITANNINSKENTFQPKNTTQNQPIGQPPHISPTDILKNQIFGKIPSFVNFLLSINATGGQVTMTPQAQSLATSSLFPNDESRENFIKLLVSYM